MNAFLEYLVKYVQLLRISDLIDILIVSVIVYYLINLIRETRAMQLVKGIIFLFMAGSIGLISGFLVADGSMIKAYNDSFDKYNIEDGHFRLNDSLSKENKKTLEKENVTIYNLNYIEEEVGSSSTIRLFKPRNKVNLVCIMDGKLPQSKNEIAIDRM